MFQRYGLMEPLYFNLQNDMEMCLCKKWSLFIGKFTIVEEKQVSKKQVFIGRGLYKEGLYREALL